MNIIKVTDGKTMQMFLDTARIINRNDKTWVCPLDNDIKAVFDPAQNPYHNHGVVEKWILKDEKNKLLGRIAAFIDYNLANSYDQPTGGIGFFECFNDKQAAFILFDTAKGWLREKGMEAMDGPINFGEADKYWGLLIDGFTHPSFDVPYNQPYYQDLFESYGFQVYYKMEGFHADLHTPLPERFSKIAERILNKPEFSFRHFTWKNQEKFCKDFIVVYNEAWVTFKKHFEPLEIDYIKSVLKKSKPIIDEEFFWMAYYNEKPVGIFLVYPDVNQIFKHLNGKMNFINMLRFVYYKKRKTMTRAKGLLMGIIPQFHNRGIESAFILNIRKVFDRKPHYDEIEFSWVADFNPKMKSILISVGCESAKTYATYRYLFDRTKEFIRYPIPQIKTEARSTKVLK